MFVLRRFVSASYRRSSDPAMAYELRSMEGISYRHPPPPDSPSTLSGCRYLRCKALTVIIVGVLLIIGFVVASNSALIIVGLCVIIIGAALLFMDFVARNVGKADPTRDTGRGMNITWNRIRYRRQRRLRTCRRENRLSVSTEMQPPSSTSSTVRDEVNDVPPDYELSINVQDLMRCPEPSDWTFLPSEPPPLYHPPTTGPTTCMETDEPPRPVGEEPSMSDEPVLPVYSISRQMSVVTLTLPSYEEAISNGRYILPINPNSNHGNERTLLSGEEGSGNLAASVVATTLN